MDSTASARNWQDRPRTCGLSRSGRCRLKARWRPLAARHPRGLCGLRLRGALAWREDLFDNGFLPVWFGLHTRHSAHRCLCYCVPVIITAILNPSGPPLGVWLASSRGWLMTTPTDSQVSLDGYTGKHRVEDEPVPRAQVEAYREGQKGRFKSGHDAKACRCPRMSSRARGRPEHGRLPRGPHHRDAVGPDRGLRHRRRAGHRWLPVALDMRSIRAGKIPAAWKPTPKPPDAPKAPERPQSIREARTART